MSDYNLELNNVNKTNQSKSKIKMEDFINVLQYSSYVKQQVTEEIKQQVTEEIKQQVTEEIKQQVTEEIKQQVTEEIKQQVKQQMKTNIKDFINVLQYSSFLNKENTNANIDYSKLFEKDTINYNLLI